MLKLAIVRVNESSGRREILLEVPLGEQLLEELHTRYVPGFRKRNKRKALEALHAVERRLKDRTVTLP